jgi:hypothetical protein
MVERNSFASHLIGLTITVGDRRLPIWIDAIEAQLIASALDFEIAGIQEKKSEPSSSSVDLAGIGEALAAGKAGCSDMKKPCGEFPVRAGAAAARAGRDCSVCGTLVE